MLGEIVFHAIQDADREDGLHVLRLEKTPNNVSIPIASSWVQEVSHEGDRGPATQGSGLLLLFNSPILYSVRLVTMGSNLD